MCAQKLKNLDFFHRKVNADAVKRFYGTRKIKINGKMPILLKLAQDKPFFADLQIGLVFFFRKTFFLQRIFKKTVDRPLTVFQ